MFQGHGDDGYLFNQPLKADFSTNVWEGGSPAGLKDYVFSQWDKVHRYPEVLAESLTKKIAANYDFDEDNVLVTNGSTESIYLIAQAFKTSRSAIVIPAFAEYEDACRMHDHELSFLHWDEFKEGNLPKDGLLFICNPNNPTGAVITDLELYVKKYKELLFIVDEAFIEFTLSITSIIGLTQKYDNVVVMRSMTKAYAVPGLRLGYIIAHPALIQRFKALKLPWSVNVLALEAGHFIFEHSKNIQLPIRQMLQDKEGFMAALAGMPILIHPGHTHFFLAELTAGTAAELKLFLLEKFSLLIRDASNFRGLSPQFVRIATLSAVKNNLLINALSEWKRIV
ncbi:histidinol-phosphate transaminase [Pedobacter sp. L105]|uniref:pyridoxal phosphate-dependent aminotransferase n=1 Tax=Pedobacter sp. L105 TaxID=1641871 RepID=UPI00131C98AB|nr:aminotransferase class I/II-fold pyridoxal phosphate-dependent enzyme [Pedobacter sp. L105]